MKIKPCCMCGCQTTLFVSENENGTYYVWCSKCDVLGPEANAAQEAVNKWNVISNKIYSDISDCLYCGSDDVKVIDIEYIDDDIKFRVECFNCHMTGPLKNKSEEAIAAWNFLWRKANERTSTD